MSDDRTIAEALARSLYDAPELLFAPNQLRQGLVGQDPVLSSRIIAFASEGFVPRLPAGPPDPAALEVLARKTAERMRWDMATSRTIVAIWSEAVWRAGLRFRDTYDNRNAVSLSGPRNWLIAAGLLVVVTVGHSLGGGAISTPIEQSPTAPPPAAEATPTQAPSPSEFAERGELAPQYEAAAALMGKQEWAAAVDAWYKLAELEKPRLNDAYARMQLGLALNRLRRYQDARGELTRSLYMVPNDAMTNFVFAINEMGLGHWTDAVEKLQQATALQPDVAVYSETLDRARNLKSMRERIDQLQGAEKVGPLRDYMHRLIDLEYIWAAQNAAEELMPLVTNDPDVERVYGITQLHLGHPEWASIAFRRAIDYGWEDAEIWALLGMALEADHKREDSVEAFRNSLALDQTFEVSRTALKRLGATEAPQQVVPGVSGPSEPGKGASHVEANTTGSAALANSQRAARSESQPGSERDTTPVQKRIPAAVPQKPAYIPGSEALQIELRDPRLEDRIKRQDEQAIPIYRTFNQAVKLSNEGNWEAALELWEPLSEESLDVARYNWGVALTRVGDWHAAAAAFERAQSFGDIVEDGRLHFAAAVALAHKGDWARSRQSLSSVLRQLDRTKKRWPAAEALNRFLDKKFEEALNE